MASKTGKSNKSGRNAVFCKFYALTHRREKNKLVRVKKHLVRHPNDRCAEECAKVLKAMV